MSQKAYTGTIVSKRDVTVFADSPEEASKVILKRPDGVETVPLAVMTSPDIRQRLIPPATLEFQ